MAKSSSKAIGSQRYQETGLPVAGAPRLVPQPEAVDLEAFAVDLDGSRGGDMLLVMGLRERRLGVLFGFEAGLGVDGPASVHRGDAPVGEVDEARHGRVLGECHPRVGHLAGFVEQADLALVADPEPPERLLDVDAQAAGVEHLVRRDRGPLVHEPHPAVG